MLSTFEVRAFRPLANYSLAATNATGRVNISTNGGRQVRLYNSGTVIIFVKFGDSTVNAATTDTPIPPGAVEVLTYDRLLSGANNYVAGITAAGSGTLYITVGEGL